MSVFHAVLSGGCTQHHPLSAPAAKNRVVNAHGGPKRRSSTCAHSNSTICNKNVPYTHATSQKLARDAPLRIPQAELRLRTRAKALFNFINVFLLLLEDTGPTSDGTCIPRSRDRVVSTVVVGTSSHISGMGPTDWVRTFSAFRVPAVPMLGPRASRSWVWAR